MRSCAPYSTVEPAMASDLTQMNPSDLAGAAAVWLMGLIFLAMNAIAICRYLKNGR